MKVELSGLGGLAAGEALGEVVRLVTRILNEPTGDARIMPFAPSGTCKLTPAELDDAGIGGFALGGISSSAAGYEVVPAEGPVHPLYASAFGLLDSIADEARACGVPADFVRDARAVVAHALNRGVYNYDGGGDGGFVCMAGERPTIGQVNALLTSLATTLDERCTKDKVGRVAAAVADATKPAAKAGVSPLALLGGAGLLAGLWWALRGAA